MALTWLLLALPRCTRVAVAYLCVGVTLVSRSTVVMYVQRGPNVYISAYDVRKPQVVFFLPRSMKVGVGMAAFPHVSRT